MINEHIETFDERKDELKDGFVEGIATKQTKKFISRNEPIDRMIEDFGKSSAELRQVMEQNANARFDEFHNKIKSEQHTIFSMILVMALIFSIVFFVIIKKLLKIADNYFEVEKTKSSNGFGSSKYQCRHYEATNNKKHGKGCYCNECIEIMKSKK